MDPVSLDAAVLKLRFPDLVLRPGMQVVARVASRGEGTRAAIVLAGTLLGATVPEQVRTGDTLRLRVAETTAERIVLQLESATPQAGGADAPQAAAQAQRPADQQFVQTTLPPADQSALLGQLGMPPAPLRPGEQGAGDERAGARRGGDRAAVALSYETPALGRLDLRLEQGPEGVVVVVAAERGTAQLAVEHAEELRAALEQRTHRAASVRVEPRREPLDTYA